MLFFGGGYRRLSLSPQFLSQQTPSLRKYLIEDTNLVRWWVVLFYPLLATFECQLFFSGSVLLARVTPKFLTVTGFLSFFLSFVLFSYNIHIYDEYEKGMVVYAAPKKSPNVVCVS